MLQTVTIEKKISTSYDSLIREYYGDIYSGMSPFEDRTEFFFTTLPADTTFLINLAKYAKSEDDDRARQIELQQPPDTDAPNLENRISRIEDYLFGEIQG